MLIARNDGVQQTITFIFGAMKIRYCNDLVRFKD